ncbi:hypothetical protein HPB50_013442 [Hyalomma asiaticum]|uniref:Uncharacterized protein n=1 Tax=Hyalomma asiaticum TaxID=266040 RepID=A0ACB7SJ74_HYAAI|nr:hypothetical protein HPB50_013442 [Hyalomma asiaticum]
MPLQGLALRGPDLWVVGSLATPLAALEGGRKQEEEPQGVALPLRLAFRGRLIVTLWRGLAAAGRQGHHADSGTRGKHQGQQGRPGAPGSEKRPPGKAEDSRRPHQDRSAGASPVGSAKPGQEQQAAGTGPGQHEQHAAAAHEAKQKQQDPETASRWADPGGSAVADKGAGKSERESLRCNRAGIQVLLRKSSEGWMVKPTHHYTLILAEAPVTEVAQVVPPAPQQPALTANLDYAQGVHLLAAPLTYAQAARKPQQPPFSTRPHPPQREVHAASWAVPGNYDGGPKVRLFSFPSDQKRKAEWQRAVRRDDVDVAQLKDPKVCERHIKPEYLRTTLLYTNVDGRTIKAPMKLTRLTPDALPTIFPDCPAYVSDKRKRREDPEERKSRTEHKLLQRAIQQSKITYENESQENKVQNLSDITSRVERIQHKVFWSTAVCDSCVIFAHMEMTSEAPDVTMSVVWWKIANVKTLEKGHRQRDVWQEPLRDMHFQQIEFLDNFVTWLDAWSCRGTHSNGLTKETHFALRLSTYALFKLARYSLHKLGFRYVLLGEFQTDSLEARFGKYRQLCGSQYNVSITQVFEAETKIRLQNTLVLEDLPSSNQEEKTLNVDTLISKYSITLTDESLKSCLFICNNEVYKAALPECHRTLETRLQHTVPLQYVAEVCMRTARGSCVLRQGKATVAILEATVASSDLKDLQVTSAEARELEMNSRQQSRSNLWQQARLNRLTASCFGRVIKRLNWTEKGLYNLTESKDLSRVRAIQYGLRNENVAADRYCSVMKSHGHNVSLRYCGLFVNPTCPWLGASPDRLIYDPEEASYGVLEVKCPYSLKDSTPEVAKAQSVGHAIKKFHTKHKFGKRVRRSLAENFRKRPATTQDNGDDKLAAAIDNSVAGLTDTSPASPSVADNVAESGHVHHDRQILQPKQIEEKKKAKERWKAALDR